MTKKNAVIQSSEALLSNARDARRAYDKTWNSASKAPMFCRINTKALPDGKKKSTFRTCRLISTHALKTASSGAALYASETLQSECDHLRLSSTKESARAPWLPTLTSGARLVLEQFLSALAQEAAHKAHAFREGSGESKRLSSKHIKAGWDSTFESVFGNSSLMPQVVVNLPSSKKVKNVKKLEKAVKKTKKVKSSEPGNDVGMIEAVTEGD